MFWKRITLFRLLGFAVRIDASWIVIALLVTWSLAAGLFPEQYPNLPPIIYWTMGILGAFGLFFSIISFVVVKWLTRMNKLPKPS